CEGESSAVRAVLLNQVPFVLSWLMSLEVDGARLSECLQNASPEEIRVEGIPELVPLLRAYFAGRGQSPVIVAGKTKKRRAGALDWKRLETFVGGAFQAKRLHAEGTAPLLAATFQPNSTRAFLPV